MFSRIGGYLLCLELSKRLNLAKKLEILRVSEQVGGVEK
jgi:hypothetical protein